MFPLNSLHFANDDRGSEILLANLDTSKNHDIVMDFEFTTHYHQTLFHLLTVHHFKCYRIAPYGENMFIFIFLWMPEGQY